VTGSRIINVLTAHAQTLLPQKWLKMLSRPQNGRVILGKRALNSNMTSYFKPEVVMWSKLRMRSEKLPK